MTGTIRVVIADDHPLILQGVRETLRKADDITVVGEATRGDDAQRVCQELRPDVLLLDLQMPGPTAHETVTVLHTQCPTVRVVILTAYDDAIYIHRMIATGIAGYVLKDEVTDVVLTAVRTVAQGGTWFSRCVLETLATWQPSVGVQTRRPHLTRREQQLLDGIAQGWRNDRIATELNLTEPTVRHYVSNLYTKLDISSRGETVVWAKEHGFGPS
jgi:DNA-binding NarL/FixJ family response regulator